MELHRNDMGFLQRFEIFQNLLHGFLRNAADFLKLLVPSWEADLTPGHVHYESSHLVLREGHESNTFD